MVYEYVPMIGPHIGHWGACIGLRLACSTQLQVSSQQFVKLRSEVMCGNSIKL